MTKNIHAIIFIPKLTKYNVYGYTPLVRSILALKKTGVNHFVLITNTLKGVKRQLKKHTKEIKLEYFKKEKIENAINNIWELNSDGVFVFSNPLVVDFVLLNKYIEIFEKDNWIIESTGKMVLTDPKYLNHLIDLHFNINILKTADKKIITNGTNKKNIPNDHHSCHYVLNEVQLKNVKKLLIKNLTKSSDGWVSRNLNRPISNLFSRPLSYTFLVPNQITFITGLIAFVPCYFMYEGGYWNWLIGAAIYHLASVLDGVDGEIARLKMKSSKFGQWLDTILDFVSMVAVLLALVLGVWRSDEPQFLKWSGILAMVLAVLCIVSLLLFIWRFKQGGSFTIQYSFMDGNSRFDCIMQSLAILGRRDFYIFLFLGFAVLGLMPWALFYVFVLTLLVFVFSLITHFKTAPQCSTQPAPAKTNT